MNKPLLMQTAAFDATKEKTFTYVYYGSQQFKVQFSFRDAQSNAIVYQEIQTTFQLKFGLLPYSLQNGKSYTVECIVYDRDDNPSPVSDKIFVKCFSTPSFFINNLVSKQIVKNSSYELDIGYTQTEGELLNSFYVTLYNINHSEIHNSSMLYPSNGMSYLLTGLMDNQKYFVKIFGSTVNGMIIETPEIDFSVDVINPAYFSKITFENLPREGTIKIQSNITPIDGESNPDPAIFIDNEKVDLRNPNHWVKYSKGFNIKDDFLIKIECRNITLNKTFFSLNDNSSANEITLQKWCGTYDDYEGEQNYIVLNAKNGYIVYRHVSNLIPRINDGEEIIITVLRINNLYSLTVRRK